MNYGKLYLVPNHLGEFNNDIITNSIINIIKNIDYYIFENEKPGRAYIKNIFPSKDQSKLEIYLINKKTNLNEIDSFLNPCKMGLNMALISDAGCPGIADPGSEIIYNAHKNGIKVIPLVGPSSIFLALMSSGMNGQNFKFNGYLPIEKNERKKTIKFLEKKSILTTQIFMETPYRNNKLFNELINELFPETKLCIACDISLKSESIKTMKIKEWKNKKIDLNRKPSIFLIQSE
ncbi:MAG: SAM-dependent methyltransferase [Flavobacteriaceae bacterium]|nr:SAM-dependent methyltransferase [Flavobacteriaceae bacterium]